MSKLSFNLEECKLLAHALNFCKVNSYSLVQREAIPALGRKLADYLADPNAEKRIYKKQNRLKSQKKLIGFAALEKDIEYQQMQANLNKSLAAAAARSPIE